MQNRQISIENIQKTVADYYKIRISDMHSKKRSRAVARPRQVAMALAKELTQLSLPEIGSNFGGRDHTTVLHACRQIAKLRETDSGAQPRRQFPAAGAAQLTRRHAPQPGRTTAVFMRRDIFCWKTAGFQSIICGLGRAWIDILQKSPQTIHRRYTALSTRFSHSNPLTGLGFFGSYRESRPLLLAVTTV